MTQPDATGLPDGTDRPFHDWLAAAQFGDESGFALLWRHLNPGVLRYLRVAAGDAADDLASETWLQVVRGLRDFRGDEPAFRAWVFTIARHRAMDWRRQQQRRPTTPLEPETDGGQALDDTEQSALDRLGTEAALRVIAQLPAEHAELIVLRVVAGLDVAHVARMLHKSPGAIRVATHRALRRLQDLQDLVAEPSTPAAGPVPLPRSAPSAVSAVTW